MFAIYGIIEIMIPFANSFFILMFEIVILGMMDGIFSCFIVPIACDLVNSVQLSNQAIGYYHALMAPMLISNFFIITFNIIIFQIKI